jgi:Ca-activated chloride channel family protein
LLTGLTFISLLAACPRPRDVVDDPITLGARPTDPKLVSVSSDLSAPVLHPEQSQEFFARVAIDASSLPGAPRPAVNLALALDVSGSMEGGAIDEARQAALALLDSLEEGDRFSLVTFGGKVELAFASQALTQRNRQAARVAIESIEARGTTEMLGGLGSALQQAQAGFNAEGVNRVVLLSDGVPNEIGGIAELGDQAAASGITITSLGLGLEFDEILLTQLSQRSGGRYHYVEDHGAVGEVFASELLQMRRVVARGLALSLRPGPGVQILEVLGHAPSQNGAATTVSFGELADNESRELIVRVRTSPHREGARVELMDLNLSFEDVAAGAGYLTRESFLAVGVGSEVEEEEAATALEVERVGERASAAAAMLEVVAIANSGQYAQALARLDAALSSVDEAATRLDDEELRTQATDMRELAESWAGANGTVAIAVETPGDLEQDPKKVGRGGSSGAGPGLQREEAAPRAPAAPDPGEIRRNHAKAMEALHH